jgi:hypothetical protein
MSAELHLAEDALALHLLLEGAKRLVDVVVSNQNLHASSSSSGSCDVEFKTGAKCAQPS